MSDPHIHCVLLAEDDYAFRWAVAIELERNGIDLEVAENGAEAVELLEKTARHCCVVVDLRMPRVSGEELIARARALRPAIPIVIVTAFPDDVRPGAGPAPVVLQKPVLPSRVCEAARSACSAARS